METIPSDCTCPTHSRSCPECGEEVVTAAPFSYSGREARGQCLVHGRIFGTLTKLSRDRFRDSRGYISCPRCGLVLDETPAFVGKPAGAEQPTNQNHYARLIAEVGGPVRQPSRVRNKAARHARTLYDAETLCSMFDIRDDLKAAVLHAVESYLRSDRRGFACRAEAAIILIIAEVCDRRKWRHFDESKAITAFNVTEQQRRIARKRISAWFPTYWSPNP